MQNPLSFFSSGGSCLLRPKGRILWALVESFGTTSPWKIRSGLIAKNCSVHSNMMNSRMQSHPEYDRLFPLVKSMGKLIREDYHWVKEEKYKHPEYLHDALQRVILNFALENKDAPFMDLQKNPGRYEGSPQQCREYMSSLVYSLRHHLLKARRGKRMVLFPWATSLTMVVSQYVHLELYHSLKCYCFSRSKMVVCQKHPKILTVIGWWDFPLLSMLLSIDYYLFFFHQLKKRRRDPTLWSVFFLFTQRHIDILWLLSSLFPRVGCFHIIYHNS